MLFIIIDNWYNEIKFYLLTVCVGRLGNPKKENPNGLEVVAAQMPRRWLSDNIRTANKFSYLQQQFIVRDDTMISQDFFSDFRICFYKYPFASKLFLKKRERSSHQGKKERSSLYCVQTSDFLAVRIMYVESL